MKSKVSIPQDTYNLNFFGDNGRECKFILTGTKYIIKIRFDSGYYQIYKKTFLKMVALYFRTLFKPNNTIYLIKNNHLIKELNKVGIAVCLFKEDIVCLLIITSKMVVECPVIDGKLYELSIEEIKNTE